MSAIQGESLHCCQLSTIITHDQLVKSLNLIRGKLDKSLWADVNVAFSKKKKSICRQFSTSKDLTSVSFIIIFPLILNECNQLKSGVALVNYLTN